MIRRCFAFLLGTMLTLLLLSLQLFTRADVLIEPENDFYEQHREQILYLGRSFTANGERGSVDVKQEPGRGKSIAKIENGEVTFINYSCLFGGNYWGYSFQYSGWVELDQMLVLYDYIAFEEEYRDEFHPYTGNYAEIKEAGAADIWPWPGAQTALWRTEDIDAEHFSVQYAYTDGQGREWGFVNYLYGSRNVWVCLSEPLNRDITVVDPDSAPARWVSDTVHTDIEGSGAKTPVLIIALVAGLVICTVVLIRIFWKPNAIKVEGEETND